MVGVIFWLALLMNVTICALAAGAGVQSGRVSAHPGDADVSSLAAELSTINREWDRRENAAGWPSASPASGLRGDSLIQRHLHCVGRLLRERPDTSESATLRASRRRNLEFLADYSAAGRFPQNEQFPLRTPLFKDEGGRLCAVGYLLHCSGADELIATVERSDNRIRIRDIDHPDFLGWAAASGLTIDELALIQPSYDFRPKEPMGLIASTEHQLGSLALDSLLGDKRVKWRCHHLYDRQNKRRGHSPRRVAGIRWRLAYGAAPDSQRYLLRYDKLGKQLDSVVQVRRHGEWRDSLQFSRHYDDAGRLILREALLAEEDKWLILWRETGHRGADGRLQHVICQEVIGAALQLVARHSYSYRQSNMPQFASTSYIADTALFVDEALRKPVRLSLPGAVAEELGIDVRPQERIALPGPGDIERRSAQALEVALPPVAVISLIERYFLAEQWASHEIHRRAFNKADSKTCRIVQVWRDNAWVDQLCVVTHSDSYYRQWQQHLGYWDGKDWQPLLCRLLTNKGGQDTRREYRSYAVNGEGWLHVLVEWKLLDPMGLLQSESYIRHDDKWYNRHWTSNEFGLLSYYHGN